MCYVSRAMPTFLVNKKRKRNVSDGSDGELMSPPGSPPMEESLIQVDNLDNFILKYPDFYQIPNFSR